MSDGDRLTADYLVISKEQQQQTIEQIGLLLREKLTLQQSLAERATKNDATNERLFLELLEIFDALESLVDYFNTNPQLTERAISRIPKSIGTIQSKLLTTLAKQQVNRVELVDTAPDWQLCQIVDTQIEPTATAETITKVVRQGFTHGDNLLRPVEVIVHKPPA
jgi:molecular chaperone GrpE